MKKIFKSPRSTGREILKFFCDGCGTGWESDEWKLSPSLYGDISEYDECPTCHHQRTQL